jgi:hypothetical protein
MAAIHQPAMARLLPAWDLPKRDLYERWPRAREWQPDKVMAKIAELSAAAEAVSCIGQSGGREGVRRAE